MALIDAKQLAGSIQIGDPETGAKMRVPGESDNAQAAVTDVSVANALEGIRLKLCEIYDLLKQETDG